MKHHLLAILIVAAAGASAFAQTDADPPVIKKMQDLGTVYVTRRPVKKVKKDDDPRAVPGEKDQAPNAIIGIDFRPMAGTDSAKIAEVVKELDTLPELETILLLGQDVADDSIEALPASKKLLHVQFFNTQITDMGVAKLARLPNLQTFKYTGMGLTDRGMEAIGKMKTLQTIHVTDAKIGDKGVLALRGLVNLRRLNVENTLASEESIEELRAMLPRLNNIDRSLF
jgi:hypothetical protein